MNNTLKILATLLRYALLTLTVAGLLSACGQKGPLVQAPPALPVASSSQSSN